MIELLKIVTTMKKGEKKGQIVEYTGDEVEDFVKLCFDSITNVDFQPQEHAYMGENKIF